LRAGSLDARSYSTLPYHSHQRFAVVPSDRGQRDNACLSSRPGRTTTTTTTTKRRQTMNRPAHKGNRTGKKHERVNRLHRLSDHWLSERSAVLLATVECLRRGGAEGCGCCGGQTDEKSPSESEEKPEVRYSMAHGLGEQGQKSDERSAGRWGRRKGSK